MSRHSKKAYHNPAALSIYIGAKVAVPLPSEARHGGYNAQTVQGTVEYIHPRGLWCAVRYQLSG